MDLVGGEVAVDLLSAQFRLERSRPGSPPFVLVVSMQVPPGITILFGPSGAGKSTVLDCIAGLQRPDVGRIAAGDEVLFDSDDGVNCPPQSRRIAYVFQTLALFPHLTAEQNVAYGLNHLPAKERSSRVAGILEAFRVDKLRARKPGEISGGERQRIALARSLVTNPRVLLLDEPLTGLDAPLKEAIIDDLHSWNAAESIPILYVTHSREEVDALGERVIAMDHGRIMGAGTPIEVLDAPRRKRLAQAAGFENLLGGTVVELRDADGVMRVRLSGSDCELEVPLGHAEPGDKIHVAIRAGDILLATAKPENLSARNVIEGRLTAMESRAALVRARVDCGAEFVVHLTPGAVRTLELAVGRRVWLVLKTHSCHFVEE
ncbi:MAG TPA: molybdenum ABC transporter ATP-binding protein [Candidatus Solibacter sp.]|nr:molybdenum ABC transporter ATP-binding protein [Candidatus Solibacter sp.]